MRIVPPPIALEVWQLQLSGRDGLEQAGQALFATIKRAHARLPIIGARPSLERQQMPSETLPWTMKANLPGDTTGALATAPPSLSPCLTLSAVHRRPQKESDAVGPTQP